LKGLLQMRRITFAIRFVRVRGFEPPWAYAHTDLNRARLPDSATPACCDRSSRFGTTVNEEYGEQAWI
jgi:hypothetical protein